MFFSKIKYLTGLILIIGNLQSQLCKYANNSDSKLLRTRRQFDAPPTFFAPAGVNEDHESRAPVSFELMHNLTTLNGPSGRCGICWRRYRVLYNLRHKASEECRRYFQSRQAALGDLTEFYHTLYNSYHKDNTVTFLLSDYFPDFTLSASYMVPPHLMIETSSNANQALCVESIKCPEPNTRAQILTNNTDTSISTLITTLQPLNKRQDSNKLMKSASGEKSPSNFWDAIVTNSSPKSWVIATLALLALSLSLLIALICTCILVCNAKRQLRRKRCRGTCRFGCKCSSDAIRQAAADAAVCGPLGPSASVLTNGSLMGYSNIGRSCYLGLSGKNSVTPIYVSMAANDKLMTVQSSDSPNLRTMEFPSSNVGCNILQGQNWPQYQLSMSKSNRVSHNGIWRSQSDGSSLSEQTVPSGVGSALQAPRVQPTRSTNNANASSIASGPYVNSYGQDENESAQNSNSQKYFDEYKLKQIDMKMSTIQDGNGQSLQANSLHRRSSNTMGYNRNGFNQNLDLFDSNMSAPDPANITPPAGFFDKNTDKECTLTKDTTKNSDFNYTPMEQSWMQGGTDASNLPRSTFSSPLFKQFPKTSTFIGQPLGGVKVLPTSAHISGMLSPQSDFRRRNGYLNGDLGENTIAYRQGGVSS